MTELKTEAELAEKIRSGDTTAFENLFHKYCQSLIHFAWRYVREVQTAENIVQDAFLKVWTNRKKIDPEQNLKSYLYKVVKNQALQHLRHAKVENKYEDAVQTLPSSTDPEENLSQREIAEAVQRAIDRLPPQCRMVFKMSKYDHMTYAEIAEIQEISIKTVETHIGRALKFLRENLSHLITRLMCL